MGERPIALGGVRWWPGRAAKGIPLEETLGAALEALAGGGAPDQKRGRRKHLYLLALGPAPGPSHLLKLNEYAGWPALRRRFAGSKARHELRRAEAIAERGIATPLPLAAGERRDGWRLRRCYLLIPFLPGAEDLRRIAARSAERRALAVPFGRFARRVHDAGIDQDDFQPNNFLRGTGGADDLWLIDCERLRLRRGGLPRRERARLLAKLERELPAASLAERARFLRAYAGGESAAWRALWREVEEAARRLAGRDAARLERLLRRPGRRFRRFDAAGWSGLRAAAVAGEALAHELGAGFAGDAPPALPFALRGGAQHFALELADVSPAASGAALARALVLAHRGLGPEPAALLRRPNRAVLVFRGALPARLDALPPDGRAAQLAPLARLLERLSGLGRLTDPRPDLVGLAPAGAPLRLQLLAAPLLEPGAPAAPGGRRARRALAAHLLGLER